ncbi:MAG: hypothetical protein HY728_10005 [Candidatus Rokubacteria bacterium]|nr:hypothetical protein [Candidatus Rokubacteria bacterium]MBI4594537.1 hypothetical protein [Candidatus Rokubacteria bacterium]
MSAIAGSSRPGALRRFWDGWKRVGRKIGDFQARVLLTIVYFMAIAPFALVVRWATDPLALKTTTARGWQLRPAAPPLTLERARRQF